MSIMTSLYTGSSGINAHGDAIGIVGDNLANVSTIGYKSSRAGFEDVLGISVAAGQRTGTGVRLGSVDSMMGQGAVQQTSRALDLAISGGGMFMLDGAFDGRTGTYFSRDGRFQLDNQGTVVNSSGLKLQGYLIDAAGTAASEPSDLSIGGQSQPAASTTATLGINLDANQVVGPAWNPANPGGTSNFATSLTVYDSIGAAHRADAYFRMSGAGAWEWHVMVDGGELAGGAAGTPTEIANGTATFTPTGALDTETTVASAANFVNAAPGQSIAFDFGDSITTDGGTGLLGSTSYAAPSNVIAVSQNGFASGDLIDMSITGDGTITGVFSNGQSRAVARIAVADFANEDGLTRIGSQLYQVTPSSGDALIGNASTGSRGSILSYSLEGSNVDLAGELVTLIAYQRAFQANARTITTADEMLSEVTNLKR